MTESLELLGCGELAEQRPPCPYEPLIGSWDIRSRWFAEDGSTTREAQGEWHFSWILGGWGVQDVLFVTGAPPDQRGTTIRCYDESADCWRAVWMAPRGGEFVSLDARVTADELVQEGEALDGSSRQRWSFSAITATSFVWRGEASTDGGASWRLDQEMHGTLRPRP